MRYYLAACCFLLLQSLSAQVSFSSIPFNEALKTAEAQGKLIFLQFESGTCDQCNNVAYKGLSDKALADKINETFFCLKVDAHHPDRQKIAHDYNINATEGFATLFIDNNGTLIHKYPVSTTHPDQYLAQVDIALAKAGETLKINELEKEYKNGNRSYGFLEALLSKRQSLRFPTDSLLDEYVDALPPDSLKSINVICFISKMTPYIDSKPFKAMTADRALYSRAWYSMPSPQRILINHSMEYRSMSKAIKNRDLAYATRIASFAQGTVGGNYLAGARAYDENMLRYYDETNDTTTYFSKAIAYYARYFLSVNLDSIRKLDSVTLITALRNPATKKDTIREGNKISVKSSVSIRPAGQYYATQLNDGASKFYHRTSSPYLLSIATEWCEKALVLYKTTDILNTYAKLLYKQGKSEKAMDELNEAIAILKQRGYPTNIFDDELDAIRNKKPLAD